MGFEGGVIDLLGVKLSFEDEPIPESSLPFVKAATADSLGLTLFEFAWIWEGPSVCACVAAILRRRSLFHKKLHITFVPSHTLDALAGKCTFQNAELLTFHTNRLHDPSHFANTSRTCPPFSPAIPFTSKIIPGVPASKKGIGRPRHVCISCN